MNGGRIHRFPYQQISCLQVLFRLVFHCLIICFLLKLSILVTKLSYLLVIFVSSTYELMNLNLFNFCVVLDVFHLPVSLYEPHDNVRDNDYHDNGYCADSPTAYFHLDLLPACELLLYGYYRVVYLAIRLPQAIIL